MARVQDEAQVGGVERADDRPAVDHARDLLEPGGELDVVDRGVDRRERAQDVLDVDARLERRVPLRVEGFGLGHAAGHPEHDDGIGRSGVRLALAARALPRRGPNEAGSRPAKAASVAPAVAPMKPRPADARVDASPSAVSPVRFCEVSEGISSSFNRSTETRASSSAPTTGLRVRRPDTCSGLAVGDGARREFRSTERARGRARVETLGRQLLRPW